MTILFVTSFFDKTCDYIQTIYPELECFRLDVDSFSDYKLEFTKGGFRVERGKKCLTSQECSAIYFRKPTLENLCGKVDPQYHNFAHKESYALIEGLIESYDGRCLSKPSVLRRANNKIFQVMHAQKAGFNLPSLSITNDPRILKMWASGNDAVVKPISIGTVEFQSKKEFVQTNKLDPNLDTSSLKYTPVYLQRFINKDYEVRITAVNGKLFPARIDSNNHVDWRKPGSENQFSIWHLPSSIEQKCKDYMAMCDMDFGCFDLLVKGDSWFFLEMNANGQWGWLDPLFDKQISAEIVRYLKGEH